MNRYFNQFLMGVVRSIFSQRARIYTQHTTHTHTKRINDVCKGNAHNAIRRLYMLHHSILFFLFCPYIEWGYVCISGTRQTYGSGKLRVCVCVHKSEVYLFKTQSIEYANTWNFIAWQGSECVAKNMRRNCEQMTRDDNNSNNNQTSGACNEQS